MAKASTDYNPRDVAEVQADGGGTVKPDIIIRALEDLAEAQGILRTVEGDEARRVSLRISRAVGRLKLAAELIAAMNERSE